MAAHTTTLLFTEYFEFSKRSILIWFEDSTIMATGINWPLESDISKVIMEAYKKVLKRL